MSETAASPFAALTPQSDDRRREQREDPATSSDDRVSWLDRHWPKVAAAGGVLASLWLWSIGLIGVQVTGPADANAAQARRDTALAARVTALEVRAGGVDRTLNVQGYILCLNNRVHDPGVLDACVKIRRVFLEMSRAP